MEAQKVSKKSESQNGNPKSVQKKWFSKWKPKIFLNNGGTKMEGIFSQRNFPKWKPKNCPKKMIPKMEAQNPFQQ